ncbi:hypothetical protein [Caulobacter sp. S45]|uniref:hypothetical protein n=1 Tax=Caulobacter sp. S45 TaxID=1641861 RepID=UPI0015766FA3|nr:hypothetical protein [Caulobacter sp. S45]
MSGPGAGRPASRRLGPLNFTGLQFILFAGVGLVGLAALLAAGLAFGLALAGAAMLAVLVLACWFVVANLTGGARGRTERPPEG